MLCARCLAMSFHLSKARPDGQFMNAQPSAPRGPLHQGVTFPRRITFHLAGNRNAAHPVNALLNYAYTVLESVLRIKAIADGYESDHWHHARGQGRLVEIRLRPD